MIRALLALLLVAPVAAAQVVPPDAKRLTDVACVLSGCGGVGDIEAVNITTTAPITGSANCATGTCAFTLGLTGGVLSGLTAPFIPVAASATTVANSDLSYFVGKLDSGESVNGRKLCFTDSYSPPSTYCLVTSDVTRSNGLVVTAGSAEGAAYSTLTALGLRSSNWVNAAAEVSVGDTVSIWDDGTDAPAIKIKSGSAIGWPRTGAPDTQIARDAAGQVGVYGAGSTYGQLNVGTIQQSYSKALVDATATDVVQVPVASNSYEGFTMDYTIFATDATDYQVRQGSVPVAVLNVGGTETCVFGTATEAVNASAGTLTVAFDCTAGTNTVMVRANADTSLASTTIFTIQQRINLTSGTAVLVPQ